jgi:RNA polymerase sigma-70 factor (ECF subfamily)
MLHAASIPLPGDAAWRISGGRARRETGRIPRVEKADLVARCREGDQEAFRELFRTHREDVARLVYRMRGPSADLEDLVQEVFLQVHRSLPDFRGDSRFSTWLYRLTVNVVLMHRRSVRSRPQLVPEIADLPPPDSRPLPDEQVARGRRVAAFRTLVDRLSEKKRTVFVLHELQGLAPAEIARIVGAPVLTVRTRLFYARREVLSMIAEEPALAHLVRGPAAAVGLAPDSVPRSTPERSSS